jgi:hypothetical protein
VSSTPSIGNGSRGHCYLDEPRIPLQIRESPREDGAFMEPSRRNRWQSVANAKGPRIAETSQNRCRRMVRRGSTVRVRQRALQSPCKCASLFPALFAEWTTCARYGAVYGPLRSGSRLRGAASAPSLRWSAPRPATLSRRRWRTSVWSAQGVGWKNNAAKRASRSRVAPSRLASSPRRSPRSAVGRRRRQIDVALLPRSSEQLRA